MMQPVQRRDADTSGPFERRQTQRSVDQFVVRSPHERNDMRGYARRGKPRISLRLSGARLLTNVPMRRHGSHSPRALSSEGYGRRRHRRRLGRRRDQRADRSFLHRMMQPVQRRDADTSGPFERRQTQRSVDQFVVRSPHERSDMRGYARRGKPRISPRSSGARLLTNVPMQRHGSHSPRALSSEGYG